MPDMLNLSKRSADLCTAADGDDLIEPAVFVMGCERSGTSLLSGVLDSHPRIAMYFESYYYSIFRPELLYYGDLSHPANLDFFISDVFASIAMQSGKTPDRTRLKKLLTAPTFEAVFEALLHLYADSQAKPRGGDKTPSHFVYLSEILDRFPRSPVIFIVRDPRDTALSLQKAFNATLRGASQQWNDAFKSYYKNKDKVHLVRYEDLVSEPSKTVDGICRFMGEQFDEAVFNYTNRVPERLLGRPLHQNLYRPIDTGSVSNFKEMLPEEIALIEKECAFGMEILGYPLSGGSATAPLVSYQHAPQKPGNAPPETLETISQPEATAPNRLLATIQTFLHLLTFLWDRIRYYSLDPRRWRTGGFRWLTSARVRLRYWLCLVPLRDRLFRR